MKLALAPRKTCARAKGHLTSPWKTSPRLKKTTPALRRTMPALGRPTLAQGRTTLACWGFGGAFLQEKTCKYLVIISLWFVEVYSCRKPTKKSSLQLALGFLHIALGFLVFTLACQDGEGFAN